MINEMLTHFLATQILPRFRQERVSNYKKILAQFSKMERMNSKNIIIMWQSIMHFHSEKSQQQDQEMQQNSGQYIGSDRHQSMDPNALVQQIPTQ